MWMMGFLLCFQDSIQVDLVERVSRVTLSLRVQDMRGKQPKLALGDVQLLENGTALPINHLEQKVFQVTSCFYLICRQARSPICLKRLPWPAV